MVFNGSVHEDDLEFKAGFLCEGCPQVKFISICERNSGDCLIPITYCTWDSMLVSNPFKWLQANS